MIDTISLLKPLEGISTDRLNKALVNVTFNATKHRDGIEERYGFYKNLSIKLSPNLLKIEGSLPKFLLGNNVVILSPPQIAEALNLLNKSFPGISILTSMLSRIDVGENFILEHGIGSYLNSFEKTPQYESRHNKYNVKYCRGKRELTFYDKTKDYLSEPGMCKDILTPSDCLDVVRIEYRVKSGANTSLLKDVSKLTPAHLLSNRLQSKLARLWFRDYNRIVKSRKMIDVVEANGLVDICKVLAIRQMSEVGLYSIIEWLDQVAQEMRWDARKLRDIRSKLTALHNDTNYSKENILVKELDAKVRRSQIVNTFLIDRQVKPSDN